SQRVERAGGTRLGGERKPLDQHGRKFQDTEPLTIDALVDHQARGAISPRRCPRSVRRYPPRSGESSISSSQTIAASRFASPATSIRALGAEPDGTPSAAKCLKKTRITCWIPSGVILRW